jgi:hypothetical protein
MNLRFDDTTAIFRLADGVGGCLEAALGDATRVLPEATGLTRP